MSTPSHKLSKAQLEVLKILRHVNDEKELKEVKQLLNFYFRKKLDAAINKAESDKDYAANVYGQWLASESKATQADADLLAEESNAQWLKSRPSKI